MAIQNLDLRRGTDKIVEVHPGIDSYATIRRVTDFLDTMDHLHDAEKHTILMGALDTGVVSIPIEKIQPPREARRMSEHEIRKLVEREIMDALQNLHRQGYVTKPSMMDCGPGIGRF